MRAPFTLVLILTSCAHCVPTVPVKASGLADEAGLRAACEAGGVELCQAVTK